MNDLQVSHSSTGKPLPPEDVHEGKIDGILSKGKKYNFIFAVGTDPNHKAELDVSNKWAPNSALVKLAEKILNRPITEAEFASFDLSILKGAPCKIVTVNQRGAGNKLRAVVTSVLPKVK
jgi:hypothetical protein